MLFAEASLSIVSHECMRHFPSRTMMSALANDASDHADTTRTEVRP